MCGLAGYINLSDKKIPSGNQLLERMQQTIAHRGPNGYRIWQSSDHHVGFAHRRLSIVDLSDAGFQPMFNADKSIAVMCNGEIYNHPELKTELEALGYHYKSHSDTETILHAYQKWGIKALDKLTGMFAIVIYDMRSQELYLIRDRIGIKPLYFSLQNNIVSFASEIKALWQLPWITQELNQQALYHYLTYLITPAPMTLYKDVYKLPAGYYLKVDAHKQVSFHEWYTPIKEISAADKRNFTDETWCVEHIRTLLRNSIKQQMMSDVPYGVFLSGGIDSSLNVALMSEFTPQVKTFTVSFSDGPEYSETAWARKVARTFNTDHHEIVISEKEAFEFFEKMVHHQDEPIADCVCIPLYYVAKLLKDSGVTVVQVGEGSDELFCGYSTYAQYINFYQRFWKPTNTFIPAFAKKSIYQFLTKIFPENLNYLDVAKNWSEDKNLFWSGALAFSESWKQSLVPYAQNFSDPIIEKIYPGFNQMRDSYAVVHYHLQKLKNLDPHADFLKSMIYLELKQRLPELLLMRVDKMTMATSVEGRVPFLDHHLVEFALQMPSALKYQKGITKYILKKACKGILPNDIIYRKKMGFAAPTMRWFKEGIYFRPYFLDMLSSKRAQWKDLLHFDVVQKMYTKNQQKNYECSLQLWVIQNLIANKVL